MTRNHMTRTAALAGALFLLGMLFAPPVAAQGRDEAPGQAKKDDRTEAAAEHGRSGRGDHDGDADRDSSTNVTEDNDDNDGDTPNNVADEGDNDHPSGRDRSVERGNPERNPNQGNAESDPDDDGRGPDRSNGGQDKPGGTGGDDPADQDGNNGCGNDDDFEDDNEGWCGRHPRPTTPPAAGNNNDAPGSEPADPGTDDGDDTPRGIPTPRGGGIDAADDGDADDNDDTATSSGPRTRRPVSARGSGSGSDALVDDSDVDRAASFEIGVGRAATAPVAESTRSTERPAAPKPLSSSTGETGRVHAQSSSSAVLEDIATGVFGTGVLGAVDTLPVTGFSAIFMVAVALVAIATGLWLRRASEL